MRGMHTWSLVNETKHTKQSPAARRLNGTLFGALFGAMFGALFGALFGGSSTDRSLLMSVSATSSPPPYLARDANHA